jgi:hypothetical protein
VTLFAIAYDSAYSHAAQSTNNPETRKESVMAQNCARNLIICAALLSFCSNTFAIDVLEEVIVTATKRGDQDIQSIPASIYALSGSILEEKAHFEFRAVATSIPGLTFQDLGPGDMEFIIRGVNGNGPAVMGNWR